MAILIDKSKIQDVTPIGLVPVHVDLYCDRHGGCRRTDEGPSTTKDVELSSDNLSRIGQEHSHSHEGTGLTRVGSIRGRTIGDKLVM